MKNIILFFFLLFSSPLFSQTPCPLEGTAKTENDKAANRLKNRDIDNSQKIDESVTLEKMLASGEDSKRFNSNSYVKITGYVVEVKDGGKESANCGTNVDSLKDIHIYIGETPTSKKEDCIIVEVTHKFKSLHKGFNVKSFVGKQVNVYGFLFYDFEHHGNAKNTCTVCTNVWRRTCEEVHPVTKFELTQ